MAPHSIVEPLVRFFSPMPKDYQFVPKGDVYVTGNVRKRTHAIGATLFVVIDKHKKPIGLRCPKSIYEEVTADAAETASRRAAVVQSRDVAVEREFESELLRLYPKVPRQDAANILKRALEKRSRRVGRTGTLDLGSKVHLAVKAYIRHRHTPYEQLLKDGTQRAKARQMVTREWREVVRLWMGSSSNTAKDTQKGTANRKRKKPNGQTAPRKQRARRRPSRGSLPPDIRTSDAQGDLQDWSGAEESDDFSIFDDDSEDSDWTL
ncbi:hypothetical protein GE09DRAFT_88767 [Coniochaeta sp. 2T2.1]|nr:hypothetical protein GE09DRAFT_88767 [Coniochaeta sp. 2T2.1]